MGAFLDKPKTEKHNEDGEGNGLKYGLSSMQGWRVEMEDAHTALLSLSSIGLKDWSFFAVFDGHAGSKVSKHCAEHLLDSICATDDFKKAIKNNSSSSSTDPLSSSAATSTTSSNNDSNNDPKNVPLTSSASSTAGSIEDIVTAGIRNGFLVLDEKMREMPEMVSGEDRSGSTAVCALVSPNKIYFGNCGDSRGMLVRNNKIQFTTQDHKPVNPTERERIQNAGGTVMIQRVNGSLAVSRALGDYEYKQVEGKGPCEQLVSPEPEVSIIDRDREGDQFVVLACDGIWDVMSNEELADFVHSRMRLTNDLSQVCNQVVDTCLYKGSRDNMSIILMTLDAAPTVSQEAIDKEKELDLRLEAKIQDIVNTEEVSDIDLPYVMHKLSSEDIEGLPPGGGLSAKRALIETKLNTLLPSLRDSEAGEDREYLL